jgi:hypothetical protein
MSSETVTPHRARCILQYPTDDLQFGSCSRFIASILASRACTPLDDPAQRGGKSHLITQTDALGTT